MANLTPEETARLASMVEAIETADQLYGPVEGEDGHDLENPIEVLEGAAVQIAGELGLEVDHDSFEEVRRYLSQNIAESDWHTAAPAAPLVQLGPPQATPALPQWDGPLRPVARTPFDDVFDQEMLDEYKNRLPHFKNITGRFEPFDTEKLRDLFDNKNYSTFLNRPVLTFKDALDHSILLALFWLEEDEAAEASRQHEFVLEALPEPTESAEAYEERVAAAKQVWKDAVRERKELLEKCDAKVLLARTRWQEEKLKR